MTFIACLVAIGDIPSHHKGRKSNILFVIMKENKSSTPHRLSITERRERRSFRVLLASSVSLVLALLLQVLSNPKLIDDAPFCTATLWLVGVGVVLYFISMAMAPADSSKNETTIYGKWMSKNL